MRSRTRALRWTAASWLVGQLAVCLVAPLALCCRQHEPSHTQHACCPGVAPGQMCPMHHAREGDAQQAKTKCAMGSTCQAPDSTLISLLTPIGLDSPRASAVDLAPGADVIVRAESPTIRRSVPETPPPRTA